MIITELKYYKYNAKLIRNIQSSKMNFSKREGFIIRLRNSVGKYGFGEAAPLYTFSKETINEVQSGLEKIQVLIHSNLDSREILSTSYSRELPSLRFGIQHALIQIANENNLFTDLRVPVNYLIDSASPDDALREIKDATTQGYKTFKIKMGINSFTEELKLLDKISNEYPEIQLRIDLNGCWKVDEARTKIKRLEKYYIEYIEQPVSGLNELFELADQVSINLAPDESITTKENAITALNQERIKYIVIKPMNIGFEESIDIIKYADSVGKTVVISSMFESFLGVNALLYLASLTGHTSAHGINYFLEFENNLLNQNYPAEENYIKAIEPIDSNPLNQLFIY